MYRSVGRRYKWLEVYARPPHSPRRFERSMFRFLQMECLRTYTPTICKGEHPGQQGPASLYRRLRPLDHYWYRDSPRRWGLSEIVTNFERHAHVVYWWGDTPVDES